MSTGFIKGTKYELVGSNKPALVLIHGLGLNRKMWKYQTKFFKNKYQVLTYDLYGHGSSKNSSKKPSLKVFSNQLRTLLEKLDLSTVVIIGFSLGGMIARHFARLYSNKVLALIILNSPHKRDKTAQQAVFSRYKKVKRFGPEVTVEDAIKRWFTPDFDRNNKEVTDLVRSWVLSNRPKVYAQNYYVLVYGVDEVIFRNNEISCPTLVVTADQDFGNGPKMAKAIVDEIPGAELIILRGLRHMALFENHQEVNICLEKFLWSSQVKEY